VTNIFSRILGRSSLGLSTGSVGIGFRFGRSTFITWKRKKKDSQH